MISGFRSGLPTAVIGKINGDNDGSGASCRKSTWFRIAVWMLLLINEGARNARLNETRKVLAAFGLIMNVVRGENATSLIDENLSTRAPTTHRKCGLMSISS